MNKDEALKLALDALRVARESVSEWSSYASDYFKDKYDLDGDFEAIDSSIEAIEAALADHFRDATKIIEQPNYRAVKTWHEGKPVYVAEQPAQQPNEADELIRNLGFDPEQFRTEAGFINHMKLRAAIQYPDEYQAAMQPMYQKLTNCILCGRLNPKEGVCDHGVEQPAQGDNK